MELEKDYDCSILYHSGKANVVVDALSRKSAGNLTSLEVKEQKLMRLYPEFETLGVQLEVVSSKSLLAHMTIQSILVKRIKEA